MVLGASWPTINANEQLTVQSPVVPAIANGDLRACNTLLQETNVVLVPQGAAARATVASAPAPVPPVATVAAVPVPVPPQQVVQQVVTTQRIIPQPIVQAPAPAPTSYSSNLDITKINANFGNGLHNPFSG